MARKNYVRVTDRVLIPSERKANCKGCQKQFEYTYFYGSPQSYCGDFCRRNARHTRAKAQPLCVYDGCKNLRGYSSGLCNSCYYRVRRTGTVEVRKWKYRCINSNGYVVLYDSDHPLASSQRIVSEHRAVLYDAIGKGPHPCHWCGSFVDWIKGFCSKGALVPDHLDGDKTNNALQNLVPSCNKCNATRGLFMAWVRKHKDDPWLWQMYEASNEKQ